MVFLEAKFSITLWITLKKHNLIQFITEHIFIANIKLIISSQDSSQMRGIGNKLSLVIYSYTILGFVASHIGMWNQYCFWMVSGELVGKLQIWALTLYITEMLNYYGIYYSK